MNLGELRTEARRYLGQQGTTYVTATVLDGAINASCERVNADTGFNRIDGTIGLSTGTKEYTLPTAALDVFRVRLGSTYTPLTWTSKSILDDKESGWESATAGTPSQYYVHGNKLGVHCKPHGTAAGTVLHVEYLRNPTALSAATNTPSWCPIVGHRTIVKGAVVDIEGGFNATGDGSGTRIAKLYQEYVSEVARLAGLSNSRSREQVSTLKPTGYKTFRQN